jgi:hypothetical protein
MKPIGFAADRAASLAVLLRVAAILAIALTGVASAHP